MFQTQTVAD